MLTLTCCQDHILTENLWFVWSKTSYSGDERRCHQAGQTNDKRTREDRATQPLGCWKAEFRNFMVRNGLPVQVSPHSTTYFMFNSHLLGLILGPLKSVGSTLQLGGNYHFLGGRLSLFGGDILIGGKDLLGVRLSFYGAIFDWEQNYQLMGAYC